MKKAAFYIFLAINYCVTLLPLRVLYIFSDLLFLLLYYFPSYRRDVVAKNLRNAFPEKSEKELSIIARRYYRHMADLFIETLKLTHMGPAELKKRFHFRDLTLLNRYFDQGKDILAVCSHYNNWEWLSSMPLFTEVKALTVYKPLANKSFDRFMYNLRAKHGVEPSPMNSILKSLVTARKEKQLTVTAFIADQTPPKGEHVYWVPFLNQETSFYQGTERVAKMLDMPVVFVHIIKVRRGYYELELSLITDTPKDEAPGVITAKHAGALEDVIREKPEYWLWSHRRWKHKRPANE